MKFTILARFVGEVDMSSMKMETRSSARCAKEEERWSVTTRNIRNGDMNTIPMTDRGFFPLNGGFFLQLTM